MKPKNLTFSICLPVFQGSRVLKEALDSVLKQKSVDFELIIGDDNTETDEILKTRDIITSYSDPRITYIKNSKNLGYPTNIKKIVSHAKNEIVFLMAQDDILAQDALKMTHDAFFLGNNIGAVTRPYFWFQENIRKPVRAILPPSKDRHTVLTLKTRPEISLPAVIHSIGQLSGLAMRRKWINEPIHDSHVFTCHVYPFLSIMKDHDVVYLKDFTVAVRIEESQSRYVSSIYDISPTEQWMMMFDSVFHEPQHHKVRSVGKTMMSRNFIGLIQLKNYAKHHVLYTEIFELIRQRPLNLTEPAFWFYGILSIIMPKSILRKLTDWYKGLVLSKVLPPINFQEQT